LEPTWTDITVAVTSMITLVVLLAALEIAYHQLKEAGRARQSQLMIELSKRWDDKDLADSRHCIDQNRTPSDQLAALRTAWEQRSEDYYEFVRVPNFFEDLAVLRHERLVSIDLIHNTLGGAVLKYWDLWSPSVSFLRNDAEKRKDIYSNFETLAKDLRALRK
jgi:hypothetical protein